jgi:hypothetical protein
VPLPQSVSEADHDVQGGETFPLFLQSIGH